LKISITLDTNILFSALLNTNSNISQILLNGASFYSFYTPAYMDAEILLYKNKIMKIGNLTPKAYDILQRNITTIHHHTIPPQIIRRANQLCKGVDEDDTLFVAVALFKDAKLWTGDRELIHGLRKKDFAEMVSTRDLFSDYIKKKSDEN